MPDRVLKTRPFVIVLLSSPPSFLLPAYIPRRRRRCRRRFFTLLPTHSPTSPTMSSFRSHRIVIASLFLPDTAAIGESEPSTPTATKPTKPAASDVASRLLSRAASPGPKPPAFTRALSIVDDLTDKVSCLHIMHRLILSCYSQGIYRHLRRLQRLNKRNQTRLEALHPSQILCMQRSMRSWTHPNLRVANLRRLSAWNAEYLANHARRRDIQA